MATIKIIQITPDELRSVVQESVKVELKDIQKKLTPTAPTEYLTRDETSKLLSIDLSTLWSWTKKGKLNSYGIGNRVYYKRVEVEKALVKIN